MLKVRSFFCGTFFPLTPAAAAAATPAPHSASGSSPTAGTTTGTLKLLGALARLLPPLPVLRLFLQPLHLFTASGLCNGRASLLSLLLCTLRPLLCGALCRWLCSARRGWLLHVAPAPVVVFLPA